MGSTTVGIDHTFVSDLVATVRSPSGTSIELFAGIDDGSNNFCRTVFDDSAANSIENAASVDAPFSGSWQPEQPLSAFNREGADGTWEFNVADDVLFDTGSIRSVSLHLSGFVASGT